MPVDTPVLRVQFAPRSEVLLSSLLADLGQGSADPLNRECIVVQNRGMQRWLELQLSANQGIWANPWFPFPEAFARSLWRRVAPRRSAADADDEGADQGAPVDEGMPVDVEALGWAVAAALPDLLSGPAFAPLLAWLGPERDAGRLLGLSRRIARVLDGYLLDRPDILKAWESGDPAVLLPTDLADLGVEDAAWQAPLWRALVKGSPQLIDGHPARLADRLIARLGALEAPSADDTESADAARRLRQGLPRVSVFGLSALSGVYVRILSALARVVPVRVYTLAPSPADARAVLGLVQDRRADWGPLGALAPPATALELLRPLATHPLVRAQAAALRGFQMLVSLAGADVQVVGDPAATPPTLLARLQADIAAGLAPTPGAVMSAERERGGQDRSIGLHSCHGPLREAEVLRDQLLAAFDELPDLAPQDVVVMAPDLETYAPYLQAVFGVEEGRQGAIPFRVADRPARMGRLGIQAFEQALRLLRGRMTAPEVLDLLALEPVRLARGVDEEGLDRLRDWVEGAGIRWGIDGAHRLQVGQPELEGNTWRWGLARMFLGWAAPGDGRSRLASGDALPYAPAGTEPRLLGALAELEDLLVRWRGELLDARLSMVAWADRLGGFAEQILGAGDSGQEERLAIERTLGALAERALRAGFTAALGLDAVTGLLAEALEEDPPARGFLEGAVTVCALQPMRAIPFRVVALLGMNDGAFPRADRPAGFDLAARRPRLGAARTRDTDRLLFLEALVCARERLILTWTGQDARSEAQSPPSVVVAELLDVLREMVADPSAATGAETEDDMAEALSAPREEFLVQRHPLHPFSPKYFGGQDARQYFGGQDARRWFSYAADYARAGGGGEQAGRPRPPLVIEALPSRAPQDPPRILRLESLLRCWENPARYFLRNRLGISLPERAGRLADREPLALDSLQAWKVGDALVEALLQDVDVTEAQARIAAQGLLPLGTPGELAVASLLPTAAGIADLARPFRQEGPRVLAFNIPLLAESLRLTGSLTDLHAVGRVEAGYGRLEARRELRLWLRHLVLCCLVQEGVLEGVAPRSLAIGRDEKGDPVGLRLATVPDARTTLEALVGLCLEGENDVLPFYPRAAQAYAEALGVEGLRRAVGMPLDTGGEAAADHGAVAENGAAAENEAAADALTAALAAAANAFGAGRDDDAESAWSKRTDLDDPYLALTLGDLRPWDEDGEATDPVQIQAFQRLATLVYAPLMAAATRAKGDEVARWSVAPRVEPRP